MIKFFDDLDDNFLFITTVVSVVATILCVLGGVCDGRDQGSLNYLRVFCQPLYPHDIDTQYICKTAFSSRDIIDTIDEKI